MDKADMEDSSHSNIQIDFDIALEDIKTNESIARISKNLEGVRSWLDGFGFSKYFENFVLNGIVSMDIVKSIPFNDAQLKSIGIKAQQDRIIIMHHVELLANAFDDEENVSYSDDNVLIDEFVADGNHTHLHSRITV